MLKARGSAEDGRSIFIFGLSHTNLDRLREGRPIEFDGTPYGVPGLVVIFAGENEAAMGAALGMGQPGGPEVRIEPGEPGT